MGGAEIECWRCGYRSSNSAFFRRKKVGILRRQKRSCHGCAPYAATRREAASYDVSWVAVIGALILMLGPKGPDATAIGYGLVAGGTISLAHIVTLVVHELGHAAVARLVGMTVSNITLGTGPLLASYRGKKTEFQ
jgi:hypothetical protein